MGATALRDVLQRAVFAAPGAHAFRAARHALVVCVLVCAGCATTPPPPAPAPPPASPRAEPPPPPVNLQGFPLAYRQGFGDGCSTARGTERKDGTRFGNDGNYRVGWQDGVVQCKAR